MQSPYALDGLPGHMHRSGAFTYTCTLCSAEEKVKFKQIYSVDGFVSHFVGFYTAAGPQLPNDRKRHSA